MAGLPVSFGDIVTLGTPVCQNTCKKASSEDRDLASVVESTRYSIERYLPQSVSQPFAELVSAKL